MNVLQRRRQFFGGGTVIITFHGNGGLTTGGLDVVELVVRVGTVWKDISAPSFFIASRPFAQNGFAKIQGDDNTVIEPDFVVTGDMIVYASFTVVEVGIITFAGEIMSAKGWIDKYGDDLYELSTVNPYPQSYTSLKIKDGQEENLVSYIYYKITPDIAFAVPFTQYIDGKRLGVQLLGQNAQISGDAALGGYGIDITDSVPLNVNMRYLYYDLGESVENRRYPGMHIPEHWDDMLNTPPGIPQYMADLINNFNDGYGVTVARREALRGVTDTQGVVGSPFLESLLRIPATDIIDPALLYMASPYESIEMLKNHAKIAEIINELEQWRVDSSSRWGDHPAVLFMYSGAWHRYNPFYVYFNNGDITAFHQGNTSGRQLEQALSPSINSVILTAIPLVSGWIGGSGAPAHGSVVAIDSPNMRVLDENIEPTRNFSNSASNNAYIIPVINIIHLFKKL